MSMMSIKNIIVVITALFVFTCTVAAQEKTQAPPAKVIQHVPVKAVSPASGKEMYMSYCAVCHGTDGKGGGPAASALKVPPTDLTLLSEDQRRQVSRAESHVEHSRRSYSSRPRIQGDAGVGNVVLEYEQWTPK